jgi:Cu(I)/Ag(I) efflux system protein CusF
MTRRIYWKRACLSALIGVSVVFSAASADELASPHVNAATDKDLATMSKGEIVKIDTGTAKVTLRHGPLRNLNMPAMTMIFKVAEPDLLGSLKAGDKVLFTVERVDGALTVTSIHAAEDEH